MILIYQQFKVSKGNEKELKVSKFQYIDIRGNKKR